LLTFVYKFTPAKVRTWLSPSVLCLLIELIAINSKVSHEQETDDLLTDYV